MRKCYKKHGGFTLIEMVISFALLAIISVGIYNAYLLIIRQTKDGQVKQTSALYGKQTIEEIKGSILNKEITYSNGASKSELVLNGKIALEGIKDSKNTFSRTIHLDKDFEEIEDCRCFESTPPLKCNDAVYVKKTTIEKAKATNEDKTKEYDIDLDARQVSNSYDENTDRISYNFKMIKNPGSGEKSYLVYENGEKSNPIKSSNGEIILNVYIKTISSQKVISIKDIDGNDIGDDELKEIKLENHDNKQLDLYVNFSDYDKSENEDLNNIVINVYNSDEEADDKITNIYIEKSKELDVDVKTRKGEINIYNNRAESGTLVKLGTLYNIKVEINKDGETLFSGDSNENIDIK